MHVFLIEIRCCHVGYLGCYGSEWLNTPALDAIAAAGLVYDSHYADLIGATTGQPAWSTLGCDDRPVSLESLLADRGGDVCWVGSWAGITRRSLDEINPLLRQLAARKEPCLVAMGISDLMPPWNLPDTAETLDRETEAGAVDKEADILNERDASILKVRETYGSRIEAVDQWFGKFLEELDGKNLLDRAAIIVTADQGISLGEHSVAGTMPRYPYEEIRHLPLIIRLPGADWSGTRVSTVTQASDMPLAILGLLDGGHAAKSDFDLFTLGRDKGGTRDYARTVQVSETGSQTVAIRTTEWAFLTHLDTDSVVAELYRKPDDRWEINNVVQHYPDLVPRLGTLARAVPARERQ
jgi:arylsulfatase A-like enzyme